MGAKRGLRLPMLEGMKQVRRIQIGREMISDTARLLAAHLLGPAQQIAKSLLLPGLSSDLGVDHNLSLHL